MIHVLPLGDEQRHDLSMSCRCSPRLNRLHEDGTPLATPVVTHSAFDARDREECFSGHVPQGKPWAVVDDSTLQRV